MYGIITFDDVTNYGTVLQLYGLTRVLRRHFGIEARALGYEENHDFAPQEGANAGGISIDRPEEWLWRGDRFLFAQRKRTVLRRFVRDKGLRGGRLADYRDLEGVLIGSDEVFTLHAGITPARWGFGVPSDRVSTYAASFGSTTLSEIADRHCLPMVRAALSAMDHISVRDANSADIVEELTGRRPIRTLDPVLLDGFDAERQIAPPAPARPYLLVYGYDYRREDPVIVRQIETYAAHEGLEIVSVGFYHPWAHRNLALEPETLIGYFAHATGVVTNTFHGTVLGLLAGVPMTVFPTDFNRIKVTGLLEDFGLTGCLGEGAPLLSFSPDYEAVRQRLEEQRHLSLDYLAEVVQR